ncbi:MAG: hypothetical protein KDC38_08485 [Planctomycetes bacterium]|nr:hypothetical protein [Planctomycetota bacterium]
MGRRGGFSNRERIERLALEAELRAKEKAEEAAERTARPGGDRASTKRTSAKTPAAGGRMKIVWSVLDPGYRVVESFPFPRKSDAEKRARELSESTGKEHFVREQKVPA